MKKILSLFFLFPGLLIGQQSIIDSLNKALKNSKSDTNSLRLLAQLSEVCEPTDILKYGEPAVELAEKLLRQNPTSTDKFKKRILNQKGFALNNLGFISQSQGRNAEALKYFDRSLKTQEEIGDKRSISGVLNNIAFIFNSQGDIPKALEFWERSLKLDEEIGNKKGMATSLNNIGVIYKTQGDIPRALDYYIKSLKMYQDIDDKNSIGFSLSNIGIIYYNLGNIPKALEFQKKSVQLRSEIGDKNGIAQSLNNLGNIYKNMGDMPSALEYYEKSLKIREEIVDKKGIAASLNNIGSVWFKQRKYPLAFSYSDSALVISRSFGFPENIRNTEQLLSQIDSARGNYGGAFEHYKQYVFYRDSLNNKETRKASIKNQLKYDYDKKAVADSVRVGEEKKVISAKLNEEKTKSYALYGGLGLVMIFAGFMVNRFRVTNKQKKIIELKEQETQKQNEIITHQKHLVEEKHLEITDSINYAERIQRAMLASKKLLDENASLLSKNLLHEEGYFIFFQPKDVVSGDFYWASKLNNGQFCMVTADSTGHGVPGAIMSMLNMNSLKEAVTKGLTEADDILNYTRSIIINTLSNDGSKEGGKDGMDCSVLIFDYKTMSLNWVAANNPVWIVRETEVIELKPQKMPVGKHDRQNEPFVKQTFQLQKNDIIYAITDGYPDQFGGEKGKKFMSKNLKELLKNNAHLPMREQKSVIAQTFKNWVGDQEQVDDVTIIGIKA